MEMERAAAALVRDLDPEVLARLTAQLGMVIPH